MYKVVFIILLFYLHMVDKYLLCINTNDNILSRGKIIDIQEHGVHNHKASRTHASKMSNFHEKHHIFCLGTEEVK